MLGKIKIAIQKKFGKKDADAHTSMQWLDNDHIVIAHALLHGWHMSVYTAYFNGDVPELKERVYHGDFDSCYTMAQLMDIARQQVRS